MDISLDLVIEAARRRLAAITPEGAGYIVLLATQQLVEHPCRVLPADVLLRDDGEVRVRALPRASERDVEAALRTLLATLLALSPSPVPAISAVVERDVGAGLRTLAAELSAALIPINHSAARRALARLYRETRRAGGLGVAVEPVAPAPAAREPAPTETAPTETAPTETAPTETAVPSAVLVDPRSEPTAAPAAQSAPERVASAAWAELDIDVELDREVAPVEREREATFVEREATFVEREATRVEREREATPVERVAALPVPPALELRDPGLASIAPSPPSERSRSGAPLPTSTEHPGGADLASPVPGPVELGPATCRSNIRELLASYLSQTRAEEPMTQALREMIGLPASTPGSSPPPSPRDPATVSR